MKTIYINRCGDNIVFEQTQPNKIEMSGYLPIGLRCGYANDYSEAYKIYLNQCSTLEEPDMKLLVEDMQEENIIRVMTYHEFANQVYESFKYSDHIHQNENRFYEFTKYVSTDRSIINMIDPSGGPYISLGTNIGRYFDGKIGKQIVEKIELTDGKIIFTTKYENN
jgi:hypothetical protein